MKLLVCMLAAVPLFAADPPASAIAKIFDSQLKGLERELVPLAEAMPADKYDFAPSNGEFKSVRTFGLQASHIATVIYQVSASVLGEKVPVETGKDENGAATLKGKDDIVRYLKDSLTYAHKAMASLTDANLTGMVKSAFGDNQVPRVSMASVAVWHSFDHYGQMVVYARMNGIVPPASKQ